MSYPHIHVDTKRKKGPKKEKIVIVVVVNQVKTAICPVLRTGSTKGCWEVERCWRGVLGGLMLEGERYGEGGWKGKGGGGRKGIGR